MAMQAPAGQLGSTTPVSILSPAGYRSGSCGYCKDRSTGQRSSDSSASYYAQTKKLSVEHYQELVDRGWRRSGTLLYKQDLRRSCCPHYTIRLPAASFVPSKDQRQTVNKWNRHVLGDDYIKAAVRLYPKTKEQKAQERHGFNLQIAIHESELEKIPTPPDPAHRFQVTLEPDTFTEEKFSLFENYQRNVHREGPSDITRSGFTRFLCASPLQRATRTVNGREQKLGSFHQCYRLDGQLIAIGVLDLLPHAVSSVYLMYHESVSQWNFGKLSAIREAALAAEAGYAYYYMGFYIHSCTKMRYKGDYKPQQVLDPESLTWHPLDGEMKQLLDVKNYVSLSREHRGHDNKNGEIYSDASLISAKEAYEKIQEEGMSLFDLDMSGVLKADEIEEKVDLDSVKVSIRSKIGLVRDLLRIYPGNSVKEPHTLKGIVAELAACVGPAVASEMIVRVG